MEFTAVVIANFLGGTIVGNPEARVNTIAKIEEGHEGAISFLANPKYEHYIYTTDSSIVLVNNTFKPTATVKATLIKVDDAYKSFASLLQLVEQSKPKKKGIHPTAVIEQSATIGKEAYIGALAYIGENVTIGDNVAIYPQVYVGDNVTIGDGTTLYAGVKVYYDCVIGTGCTVHAGTVIGADGFGFAPQSDSEFMKIPQLGNVVLEDRVEIGANASIDRATMGSTIIRKGVKIDNLIQIAHNVEIGENTVLAAQTGVSGSTKIGKNCMIGGQVGFVGHISVADGTKIGAQSGIMGNITDKDSALMGYPATNYRSFLRSSVIFNKLPEINDRVSALEKRLNNDKEER